jgi:hypothetical protein
MDNVFGHVFVIISSQPISRLLCFFNIGIHVKIGLQVMIACYFILFLNSWMVGFPLFLTVIFVSANMKVVTGKRGHTSKFHQVIDMF